MSWRSTALLLLPWPPLDARDRCCARCARAGVVTALQQEHHMSAHPFTGALELMPPASHTGTALLLKAIYTGTEFFLLFVKPIEGPEVSFCGHYLRKAILQENCNSSTSKLHLQTIRLRECLPARSHHQLCNLFHRAKQDGTFNT